MLHTQLYYVLFTTNILFLLESCYKAMTYLFFDEFKTFIKWYLMMIFFAIIAFFFIFLINTNPQIIQKFLTDFYKTLINK